MWWRQETKVAAPVAPNRRRFGWVGRGEFTDSEYALGLSPSDGELAVLHAGKRIVDQMPSPQKEHWEEWECPQVTLEIDPAACELPLVNGRRPIVNETRIIVVRRKDGYFAVLMGHNTDGRDCGQCKTWCGIPYPLDRDIPKSEPRRFQKDGDCCPGCRTNIKVPGSKIRVLQR